MSQGFPPLLVGGSGMYVQAVVDEWQIPGTDASVRARLESEMEDLGAAKMHERLQQTDPPAANTILPGDERRIVRALEVVELQGSFTAQLPAPSPTAQWVLLGVDLPRDELDKRIEQRVRQMWEQGLVMEVQGLDRPWSASRRDFVTGAGIRPGAPIPRWGDLRRAGARANGRGHSPFLAPPDLLVSAGSTHPLAAAPDWTGRASVAGRRPRSH